MSFAFSSFGGDAAPAPAPAGGFAFSFGGDAGNASAAVEEQEPADAPPLPAAAPTPAREWTAADAQRGSVVLDMVDVNGLRFRKVNAAAVGEVLGDVADVTDIVDGVYEGGLKLWECALDLVVFLRDSLQPHLAGAAVLELGAGHGLPGIYCMQQGAAVTFADYNEDVVRHVTIPNVGLNRSPAVEEAGAAGASEGGKEAEEGDSGDEEEDEEEEEDPEAEQQLELADTDTGDARFFSGDWVCVAEQWDEPAFDLVLAADTIYTQEGTERMWRAVKRVLRGTAVIAAKRYYFGTGGSVAHFCELAEADGYDVCVARSFEDGLSQIRDVVVVRAPSAPVLLSAPDVPEVPVPDESS